MTVSVNLSDDYWSTGSKAVNESNTADSSKAAFLAFTVEFHRGYPPMTSLDQKSLRQKLAALAWEKFHQE